MIRFIIIIKSAFPRYEQQKRHKVKLSNILRYIRIKWQRSYLAKNKTRATHKILDDVILTSGFGPDLVKVPEVIRTSVVGSILTISIPSGLNLHLRNSFILASLLQASRENIELKLSIAIPVQKEPIGAKKKEKNFGKHEDFNMLVHRYSLLHLLTP